MFALFELFFLLSYMFLCLCLLWGLFCVIPWDGLWSMVVAMTGPTHFLHNVNTSSAVISIGYSLCDINQDSQSKRQRKTVSNSFTQ